MLPNQNPSPEAIETALSRLDATILAAFADVTLEGGVGYFEACAIDAYLRPDDPAYQAAMAKDCATSWRDLAEREGYNWAAVVYLDARGLYYFLPACMLDTEWGSEALEYLFEQGPWAPASVTMLAMLNPAQWEALLDYYAFHVDREGELNYWYTPDPGSPGTRCSSCGLIHAYTRREARAALTRGEAEAKVGAEPACQAWRKLQAAYLRAYPIPARAYLSSPRGASRHHLFDV